MVSFASVAHARPSADARPRLIALLALFLLFIPSAIFLARNADVPQFGDIHDDSLYYVSANSLAQGHYRIESLPGKPAQTKYPPLYPLLLSIAWRVNPDFPQNLPIAAWISWLGLPLMLTALWKYYPRMGIEGWRMWLLLALLALNPYILLFSGALLSETWFTALLLTAFLLVERAAEKESSARWAAVAGVMGGLTYLTRSAGIVLLLSGALYLWFRRERRKALVFGAAMLPFVAGWMLWARLNQLHTADQTLVYYTDYFRYQIYNVSLNNLHIVLWKNLDGLLWGLGSLVIPRVFDSLFVKILSEVLAVAMISGVIRMLRRGKAIHFAIYAAGAAFMLVIWHFPPNERFVLPLAPLAFAGLLAELEHFASLTRFGLRHRDRSQRVASVVMAGAVIVVLAGALALQGFVSAVFRDEIAERQRSQNAERRQAYAWMSTNLPPNAVVATYQDPVVYLYTGRPAIRRPLPTYLWYAEDHDGTVELYKELADYAREHGATFVYHPKAVFGGDMSDSDTSAIEDAIRSNPRLTPVYQEGASTVYRVD